MVTIFWKRGGGWSQNGYGVDEGLTESLFLLRLAMYIRVVGKAAFIFSSPDMDAKGFKAREQHLYDLPPRMGEISKHSGA